MNNLPRTKNLELDISNGWLTIWLNRPDRRNALTNEMIEDFNNVFKSVREDRSVRGITFRGKEGVFCAGADLKAVSSKDERRVLRLELSGDGPMGPSRMTLKKPVIANMKMVCWNTVSFSAVTLAIIMEVL